ncbi:MAG: hypothetical protein J1F67_06590 [Muribaculaceae bacterium]|nr:hypothetical protein [Muribaculaceae bacterium]
MTKCIFNLIIIFSLISSCSLIVKSQEHGSDPVVEEENFYDSDLDEADYNSSMKILELQQKIDGYLEELNELQNSYTRPFKITKDQRISKTYMKRLADDVKTNERKLKSLDLRWNIFYQTEQPSIASDDELMNMVEDFNTIKSAVEDSISNRQNIVQAVKDFNAAEKFLADQDTIYKVLGRKAMDLSLSSKTAPQLENLKVKEQINFADIQSHYDKAKQASQLFKVSQQEMDNINNRYATLKNKSVKIQEMAYVPWIQRIKDYLLGIAAVAIIIMFINMVVSKIKAAKKMKENLKKYQDTFNRNENNDIPSI